MGDGTARRGARRLHPHTARCPQGKRSGCHCATHPPQGRAGAAVGQQGYSSPLPHGKGGVSGPRWPGHHLSRAENTCTKQCMSIAGTCTLPSLCTHLLGPHLGPPAHRPLQGLSAPQSLPADTQPALFAALGRMETGTCATVQGSVTYKGARTRVCLTLGAHGTKGKAAFMTARFT